MSDLNMRDLANVMEIIGIEAEQLRPPNEGDYYEDGLLHCGFCHSPKQYRLSSKYRPSAIVPCMCKCETERKAKEREAWETARKEAYKARLRSEAFMDRNMQFWTFETDDGENLRLSELASKYVDKFSEMYELGKGLLLYGPVGTGKTYMAACIANALIDKYRRCLVTNCTRLCNTIMGMYEGRQEFADSLDSYDLLVLDDLNSERSTEYMDEMVQNIVDARCRANKPLIVTTNLTERELVAPADMKKQRLYSRLYEMCYPFEVKGVDRRKKSLTVSMAEIEDILGFKR